MKLADATWFSASTLLKNPMRTLLTILGLGVGVAAVLTVVTLGSAGEVQVEREIDKLGVDRVWITADQSSTLDTDSAAKVARATMTEVSGTATLGGLVLFGDTAQAATVTGYDEAAQAVIAPTLAAGRFFTPGEYERGDAVALVDETLAESLGGELLGRQIGLGSRYVTVVGIIRPVAAQASAGMVVLPLRTLLDTYDGARVSELTMTVPRDQSADAVAAQAMAVLGEGFRAATLQSEIDAARSVIRIFVMVLACVAGVCMVTGGIGVMNILLVSVRERRREIGLIKAVGGTSVQVALLFLLEALCYAMLGGVLGLMLGSGMIAVFSALIGLEASLSASLGASAVGAAALLGVICGVAPALKAAAMLPADALRQQ